jgi:ATP-dependent RNA helicase RhlE
MSFNELNLIEPVLRALKTEGYVTPTPVQAQSIPIILDRKDLLSSAQTGTGKTAAFSIPLLQLLFEKRQIAQNQRERAIKVLILSPTRELAIQIGESLTAYGRYTGLRHAVIYGGVSQHQQVSSLQRGIDILVATPGRLLDLYNQRFVNLKNVEHFVLDEADRMLDMGFITDIRRLIPILPKEKQTLLFSATMPTEIQHLADSLLVNPVRVNVSPTTTTAENVKQSVYYVEKMDKQSLLKHILKDKSIEAALVFTRTKHSADKVAKLLNQSNIPAEAIHGNKTQNARQRALFNFKNKHTRVLVATDIAARGIDVNNLSYVINFELPNEPETYVHRIGRTGRAGASGIALSFCDSEEKGLLRDIHRFINKQIPINDMHPYPMAVEVQKSAFTQRLERQMRRRR